MNDLTKEKRVSDHRHAWYVVKQYRTDTLRWKEVLGCRRCDAIKGRFIKRPTT